MDDEAPLVTGGWRAAQPSGWDVCCAPKRDVRDFDENELEPLTTSEVFVLLKNNQTGVDTIVLVQLLWLILWSLASLVPGFALFDGTAGEVSALSHIGWWMAIDIIVLFVGAKSTGFGLHYNKNGVIEKGVGKVMAFLSFYIFVLVIGILAYIAHLVLSAIELSNCTSTLCVDQKGFLIALIVGLSIMTILFGWQIYRVVTYRGNLRNTLAYKTNMFEMMGPKRERPSYVPPPTTEGIPPPSAPPSDGQGGVLRKIQMRDNDLITPLMRKVGRKQGPKFK